VRWHHQQLHQDPHQDDLQVAAAAAAV
jgi:hypothetical protein